MTFAEHLLMMVGKQRAFYQDFSKHRLTAYQVYMSIPTGKGSVKKSIENYFPLPTDIKRSFDLDQLTKVREIAIQQIKARKKVNL
jgi:hypothetical protein